MARDRFGCQFDLHGLFQVLEGCSPNNRSQNTLGEDASNRNWSHRHPFLFRDLLNSMYTLNLKARCGKMTHFSIIASDASWVPVARAKNGYVWYRHSHGG